MAHNVPVGIQYIILRTYLWIITFNRLAPMIDPESSDSPQVKLMHQWGRGMQTRDLDLIAKPLHENFRYVAYPRSLGKPEQTKEEYLGQYAGIISLWAADLEVS
jgi:hypothetical protein